MPNHIISNYLAEMEERLEAPYRGWAILANFFLSCALAFALAVFLLVL